MAHKINSEGFSTPDFYPAMITGYEFEKQGDDDYNVIVSLLVRDEDEDVTKTFRKTFEYVLTNGRREYQEFFMSFAFFHDVYSESKIKSDFNLRNAIGYFCYAEYFLDSIYDIRCPIFSRYDEEKDMVVTDEEDLYVDEDEADEEDKFKYFLNNCERPVCDTEIPKELDEYKYVKYEDLHHYYRYDVDDLYDFEDLEDFEDLYNLD